MILPRQAVKLLLARDSPLAYMTSDARPRRLSVVALLELLTSN